MNAQPSFRIPRIVPRFALTRGSQFKRLCAMHARSQGSNSFNVARYRLQNFLRLSRRVAVK